MRSILLLSLLPSVLCPSAQAQKKTHSYKPVAGFVPNAKTAIRIAVAVWRPIFGKKQIASEKFYKASLSRGVWLVHRTAPKNWVGGQASMQIRKRDGRVLANIELQ